MKKRKICIITGSRAEWGLFYPLAKEIRRNGDSFILQIIATGAHLSSKFGLTYREIEKDGFRIDRKVKMLAKGDTEKTISKSISLGIEKLSEALKQLKPDLVFLLGDRFETFSAASACLFLKIPIAHIHGGELTAGSIDESLRHAITKMSYLHFVSMDIYGKRVIQMGEDESRVVTVGALGVDNIKNTKLLSKVEFEKNTGFKLGKINVMITFGPSTAEKKTITEKQFKNLLGVVNSLKDAKIIFTKPNPDMYSEIIIKMIDRFVAKNRDKAVSFTSMGRVLYLSALKHVDVVAGNSSSGTIEVPSFGIPAINIGNREHGRKPGVSRIDAKGDRCSIENAFRTALSNEKFRNRCRLAKNPYGDGGTAKRIVHEIKNRKNLNTKKRFIDIKFKRSMIQRKETIY